MRQFQIDQLLCPFFNQKEAMPPIEESPVSKRSTKLAAGVTGRHGVPNLLLSKWQCFFQSSRG